MTNTYNTLNPIGSTSPKDLFDNASNFDEAMNSPSPAFYDRFQKRRETWAGMEKMVADFLEAMGFEATHLIYVDGSPLTVLRPTQLIERAPSIYKVKAPATFPVNLTGTWATDQLLLVDVGDAALRASLASSTGATMVGSTRLDASVSTVETRLDEQETSLAHTSRLLTSAAEIIAAFPDGGTLRVGNGVHTIPAPIVIDYSTPTSGAVDTSFVGYVSKRYAIRGESWANSILLGSGTDFMLKCLGSFPVTQNFHGNDSIEDLTLTNPVRNLPNTDNSGASGIFLQTKAFTSIKRVLAKNLKLGFHLDGVLTSTFEDIAAEGCYQGMLVTNSNSISGPNSMIFSHLRVSNCTTNGMVGDVGASSVFIAPDFEGNGIHGSNNCGMVLNIPADQLAPVITITAPYFELNKGQADIYIDNLGTHSATVIIEGGTFARAGAEYVQHNIQVHSTGGGQVNVYCKGVTFLSVAGYVPSSLRGFGKVDSPQCHINFDEACTFNETTSLTLSRRRSTVQAMVVAANAAVLGGDAATVAVVSLGTGIYQLTSTGFFGLTALDYSVTANICNSTPTGLSTATRVEVQPVTGAQFIIRTFDSAGVAVNSPFTVQIAGTRYSV